MKIKKITVDAVQNGEISSKDQKNELKRCLQEMAANHNSIETLTHFYLKLNQDFDAGSSQGLLLVLGDQKADWKKYIKGELKVNMKTMMIGQCYLETNPDKSKKLNLIPIKGKAKLGHIKKLGKPMMNKNNFQISILKAAKAIKELADDESQTELNEQKEEGKEQLPVEQLSGMMFEVKSLQNTFKTLKKAPNPMQEILKIEAWQATLKQKLDAFSADVNDYPELAKNFSIVQKTYAKSLQLVEKHKVAIEKGKQKVRTKLTKLLAAFNKELNKANPGSVAIQLSDFKNANIV
ncbi:MAG: hypothetical protein MK212_08285 [Saprospiraceae bacterium]|nr:hypothetical protein [Saprospiraceae bacterium]